MASLREIGKIDWVNNPIFLLGPRAKYGRVFGAEIVGYCKGLVAIIDDDPPNGFIPGGTVFSARRWNSAQFLDSATRYSGAVVIDCTTPGSAGKNWAEGLCANVGLSRFGVMDVLDFLGISGGDALENLHEKFSNSYESGSWLPRTQICSDAHPPKISIGVPVFNGGKTIATALTCLVSQTFKDFEIVISDNASTDDTEQICRKFAELDSRIIYVRQEKNIGPFGNFQYLLNKARAPIFMWAAADDVRSDNFLEENYEFLEKNPDFVSSTFRTRFSGKEFDQMHMGDAPLVDDSPGIRLIKYLSYWHANSHMYSLFRKEVLQGSPWFSAEKGLGVDWIWAMAMVRRGKMNRLNHGTVELGVHGMSSNSASLKKHVTCSFFPFYELTKAALVISSGLPVRERMQMLILCLKMNRKAINYFKK